uniref:Uncharacterized protein n=1 Tax=Colobus angolensis palliatus TaxID=336983 RepID=A0A2K5HWW4_COLAP
MNDIRHSLLRRDALSAAKEVLYHLDIYFSSQLQSAPLPIVDKGSVELLEEFVFQVPKERSAQPKEQTKDSVRQIIFSSLFSPQGNKADDSRMSLLGKLVSMAVAVCRIPVLECAASWLQDLIPPVDLLEMIVTWIFEDPSVLQVLMTLQLHLTEKNLYGRLGLVLFDHMVPLVEEINRLADELNPLNASQEIELSLDRLAQALQVAMASGALLCTRDDLRTLCSRLPHNNLLQLVISGPVQQSPHAALPPGFYPHIHTPPLGYGAVPAHPAAHPALPTHPGHTFISGVTFPFRPIR